MPSTSNQHRSGVVVVVGTGGTIAGTGAGTAAGSSHTAYTAGTLTVESLVGSVPALQTVPLRVHQLVQMDSCDMDHSTWAALHQCITSQLALPDVAGVVVTHGTDTLEETAYFLHRTLAVSNKPVVLTAAMRPATAASPDGPQNLVDAITVARHPGACSVLAVLQQRVHAGCDLRKLHGYRLDAFSSGDAGPVALVEDGQVRQLRSWPQQPPHQAALALPAAPLWPVVDVVISHAGATGRLLAAAVASGAQGVVLAGTGNGTLHRSLLAAALQAHARGVVVRRASRCWAGGVVGGVAGDVAGALAQLPDAGVLTPVQARIELMLDLMGAPLPQR
jgi:L-asparaginase